MKPSLSKKIGIRMVRSAALFAVFGLVTYMARRIFQWNLFDEEMLSEKAVAAWNLAFLLFIFESTVFAFNRHAAASKQVFSERYASGQRYGKVKSVFLTADLYVEWLCVALLSLLIPAPWLYDCVGVVLWGAGDRKGAILLALLPLFFVLETLAHVSVRHAWVSDNVAAKKGKKEIGEVGRTVRGVALMGMVYGAAALMIPWILPFLVTVANLGLGAAVYGYIALALAAVVLAVIAAFYVRAVRKRRAFVRALQTCCTEHAIPLSDIRKPYGSVFFQHTGIDFSLTLGDTVCDCKLVAGIFPASPLIFSDTGEGIRRDTLCVFRVNVLHLNTLIDYRMDAPAEGTSSETHRKAVIVLPVPKKMYVSVQGSPPRPADTGERMGDYTLYTATGFLHALERGLLS